MAIYKGKDLMVMADGKVIAASKSCTVNVECDDIPVSSPTDGEWEHIIAGRKKWKVTTNHLVVNPSGQYPVIEVTSPVWGDNTARGSITFSGQTYSFTAPSIGIGVFGVSITNGVMEVYLEGWYDTREASGITGCISAIESAVSENTLVALVCNDTCVINADLRTAISTRLGIPSDRIPLVNDTMVSLAAIGNQNANGTGIIVVNTGRHNRAHCKASFVEGAYISALEPRVKQFLLRAGSTVTLSMQIDNAGTDYLSGQALCTATTMTATNGNLLTGGITWKGSGPLS